jgi:hypothetical protein
MSCRSLGSETRAVQALQAARVVGSERSFDMDNTNERPVIVTTAHRGIFYGWATDTDGDRIALKRARLCLYWSRDVKGFMGLASSGPTAGCRIGPPADITLRNVTAVLEVTPDAAKAWEAAPWAA